ncbi:transaldolase family protein [Microbacterium testaceum]|uniref:transaldolase family protein n=1 Tax=Microbacterium testaceum TaxID=2033 RepID=UPI0007340505|nr:transaldolase family protein [Microbacterium testaceum]KTS04712.1 hypothetical protein NS283_08575 [Microbacterium testaceum]
MLYLDGAERSELEPLLATGLFAGVTTNPTILDRAGLTGDDVESLLAWSRDRGVGTFFAQATGEDLPELRRSATRLATLGSDVVVKLCATVEGLTVGRELTRSGSRILITAVYHPMQMALADAAGAEFIAPYVGRATDRGRDGIELVRRMAAITRTPRILAASLRSPEQVAEALAAGAQDVTLSPAVARAALRDELTMAAAAEFEAIGR